MTYAVEWKAFSARIQGLVAAGHLHASFLSVKDSDSSGRAKELLGHIARVSSDLEKFHAQFSSVLPVHAKTTLDGFLGRAKKLTNKEIAGPTLIQQNTWAALVSISAFEAELTHALADAQTSLMLTSERAFIHLQRSIVVDSDIRKKWEVAFAEGEVSCEKLGSVHLLLHGIWAFKADAKGARTDLVFQEPLDPTRSRIETTQGLVLTEWKISTDDKSASKKFQEARQQAERYEGTAFSGAELTTYRYAVVVSNEPVKPPEDSLSGSVRYRYINIALNPGVPSRRR